MSPLEQGGDFRGVHHNVFINPSMNLGVSAIYQRGMALIPLSWRGRREAPGVGYSILDPLMKPTTSSLLFKNSPAAMHSIQKCRV